MSNPVSPKVTAGANFAGYATLALTLLNNVTPDSLAFLGHLAPLAYGVVIGGSYALGAFLKEDPARTAGLAAQNTPTDKAPVSLPTIAQNITAPAKTFPAAAVAAVSAPVEPVAPVTVTPVYEAPAPAPAPAEPAPAVEPAAAAPGLAPAPAA